MGLSSFFRGFSAQTLPQDSNPATTSTGRRLFSSFTEPIFQYIKPARGTSSPALREMLGNEEDNQARYEANKLKVYGLDAFQVRAEEEMNQIRADKNTNFFATHLPVQNPTGTQRRFWDLVSTFIILVSVYSALFEFSWGLPLETANEELRNIFNLISVFFWLDLIYNFFTAYYDDDGELVYDRWKIFNNYMQGYFLVDFVSNLPLEGPFGLLKTARMIRMGRVLNRWAYLGYDPTKLQVFRLIISVLTAGHVCGCAYYAVGRYEQEGDKFLDPAYKGNSSSLDEKSWLYKEDIYVNSESETADIARSYLTAMYFSYSTLTTVGFGDINATTSYERGVAIFTLTLGSAVFAAIVGTMSSLMEKSDIKETEYQHRVTEVNSFMSYHRLPTDLRNRVRRYMELDHNSTHNDKELLDSMSPMLQRETILHMNKKFRADVPFLADGDTLFVGCVLERMIVIVCVQQEYILVEGEAIEAMHILKSGKVDVIDKFGQVIRTYTQGSFFGETCFESNKQYAQYSYRAKVDMELALLTQSDLIVLLEAFPEFDSTLKAITKARSKHEEYENEVFEDKMKKMIKQTGMRARPVTPPPGKTWEESMFTEQRASITDTKLRMNPSRREFAQSMEHDIEKFNEAEKRRSLLTEKRQKAKGTGTFRKSDPIDLQTLQENAAKKGVKLQNTTLAPGDGDENADSSESDDGDEIEDNLEAVPELKKSEIKHKQELLGHHSRAHTVLQSSAASGHHHYPTRKTSFAGGGLSPNNQLRELKESGRRSSAATAERRMSATSLQNNISELVAGRAEANGHTTKDDHIVHLLHKIAAAHTETNGLVERLVNKISVLEGTIKDLKAKTKGD